MEDTMYGYSDESLLSRDVRVFGNYCEFADNIQDLQDFLDDFHKYISETENKLANSIAQREKIKKLHYEDPEVLKHYRFSTTHGAIFRDSFIISLAIVIENTAKMIADTYCKNLNLKLKMDDLSGKSYLEKFKMYFTKVYEPHFPFGESIWADLNAIVVIRNCIIHRSGDFEDYKTAIIESFYKKYSTIDIDRRLIITDEAFCRSCLKITNDFFKKVFDIAQLEFPITF